MTCVLFVATRHGGGSMASLTQLIKNLDRRAYTPALLMYQGTGSYYVRELSEIGFPIVFLDPRPPVPGVAQEVKTRDIAGSLRMYGGDLLAKLYTGTKSLYEFVRSDLSKVRPILDVIRTIKPKLIHLNNGLCKSRAAIVAARLANVPCVCHMRTFQHWNWLDRFLARWVHRFVYISRAVEAHHVEQGISPHLGTLVHNGVDMSLYGADCQGNGLREELGLSPDDVVVGNVGRLDWWKGHESFLEAMAEVARHVPHLKCLVVGGGDDKPVNVAYRRRLALLTESLGLMDRVLFTGHRNDVPSIMVLLDVLVHSASEPEPFGRVIIEAMAAARPVVATAAGGVLDIVEDSVSGLLVPPKDASSMAQSVHYLLTHQAQAKAMGLAARQRVLSRFTIEHHARQVQQVYHAVLDAAPSSSAGWAMRRS